MTTERLDQTTILDLLEQQAPAYKVNFAIGALNAQIEQIEDELDQTHPTLSLIHI